jgi:glycerol-1-phosphate dehydrogenase [NAD(P)+]
VNNKGAQANFDRVVNSETEDLMGTCFECVCGETHNVPIRHLSIEEGAVKRVGLKIEEFGISGRGVAVCDRKIEGTVVKEVLSSLESQGLDLSVYPVGDGKKLISPEVTASQAIADDLSGSARYLLALGSGVICDLVKHAATSLDIPYVLLATAPSMNGYTSSMAALTDDGIKKTLMVNPAHAVFADLDILKEAPAPMVQSGLGDIVSKSICNADWKLSQIVKKTFFCPLPFRITDKSEPLYLEAAEEIGRRSADGIRILTDGIMRSGLSMTIIGTSTPSSGAEHFLSHYWDLEALKEGKQKNFHGSQVGVATLIVLDLYEWIRNFPVKTINSFDLKKHYPNREEIEGLIESRFGRYAEGVKQQYITKYLPWEKKKEEIESIVENWDSLWGELEPYIRKKDPVEQALMSSGAPVSYRDLGKTREDAVNALLYARFIRGRYTILDLLADLGVLEEASRAVLQ